MLSILITFSFDDALLMLGDDDDEYRLFGRFVSRQLLMHYNMLSPSDTFHVYILVATTAHIRNLYETPSFLCDVSDRRNIQFYANCNVGC